MLIRILIPLLLSAFAINASPLRAGVGRVDVTPEGPIWMSGYAARTHPSEGVLTRLWIKALAIESAPAEKIVIVTADVVGIPRAVSDEAAARAAKQYGLDRRQILFNASHTHTGPVVWPNLANMAVFAPDDKQKLIDYQRRFVDALVSAIGAAIAGLAPASIEYGEGSATFGVNRREPTPNGMKIGVNPNGPVDRSVPVLKITGADGKVRAVLFGYACHNTTLTQDTYQLSGDYAGIAALELEQRHPGSTALFLMLCGADQNPNPRGTPDLARKHASALAAEVDRVLGGTLTPLSGPVRSVFRITTLRLAMRTRQDFEAELQSKNAAQARRAQAMLNALDLRTRIDRIDYPVQAVRFGRNLILVALGGEVTVDYDLRIKREFPGTRLIVAGYSNDVMCYIPSARVLKEGGYEAVDSMFYYAQAGPFAPDVENRVMAAVRRVMKDVRR